MTFISSLIFKVNCIYFLDKNCIAYNAKPSGSACKIKAQAESSVILPKGWRNHRRCPLWNRKCLAKLVLCCSKCLRPGFVDPNMLPNGVQLIKMAPKWVPGDENGSKTELLETKMASHRALGG